MLKSQLLRPGDTLVIKELNRLGRNYEQIKEEWQSLLKIGIDIEILDTPILNTSNKSDLEKALINNIIFQLFSYLSWKSGQITAKRAMELLSIKCTTFYSLIKIYEESLTNSHNTNISM
jgi:DNA invertase Pin-like site-specific DNA recombinase